VTGPIAREELRAAMPTASATVLDAVPPGGGPAPGDHRAADAPDHAEEAIALLVADSRRCTRAAMWASRSLDDRDHLFTARPSFANPANVAIREAHLDDFCRPRGSLIA
jgi:hypothetical protein